MVIKNESTIELEGLGKEFLRRVVIELNGRRFTYDDDLLGPSNPQRRGITAQTKAGDVLKVFPEMVREFAAKILPEFTRCHARFPVLSDHVRWYTVKDPISGIAVWCMRFYNVMDGEIYYRFDAAFS